MISERDCRTTPLVAGIHGNVLMADYVADPCERPSLSKGPINKLVSKSPHHAAYAHPRLGPKVDDWCQPASTGSAAHLSLLGGDNKVEYVAHDDWRKKVAKEARSEAIERGNIPMLAKDEDQIEGMAEVARKELDAKGHPEQTIVWQRNGAWLRCRPDWMSEDRRRVVEYKTTTDAQPERWIRRSMSGMGYDIQGGLAVMGLDDLLGEGLREYLWLVQEVKEPYCCSWVGLSNGMYDMAREKILTASKIWARCLEDGNFPGYGKNVWWAEPSAGAEFEWETRKMMLEEK